MTATADFINSVFPYVWAVVRALFAGVLFSMNVAVVLTWVDRRQGSMIQDRIGPDRAVIWLPRRLAQVLALGPAVLIAAGVLFAAFGNSPSDTAPRDAAPSGLGLFYLHLGMFAVWSTALVIVGAVRRRGPENVIDHALQGLGDPRRCFYAGFALHLGLLVLASLLGASAAHGTLTEFAGLVGPLLFAVAVVGGAAYAVLRMTEKRIGLRLLGLLHPAADGLKTVFKEDIVPPGADRLMHGVAPFISFFPALVVLGVVPFTDTLCFAPTATGSPDLFHLLPNVPREGVCQQGGIQLQVVDLNVGILYFFAMAGMGIVGAALAGYASNNKYSLLGGLRAASQMVSYEVTLGLTLVGAIMIYGTLEVDDMVRWQVENAWGIFVQPIAFLLFFVAAVAESKRIPFDIPEGESEIVAGYYTEYAGMKFAMFFFAEYIAVVTSSAVMAAVFLGGWHLPFVYRDGITVELGATVLYQQALPQLVVFLLGFAAFVCKVLVLCWLQLMIRWTLPRFRYDQLMKLGWRMLLPASLVNIVFTGLIVLLLDHPSAAGAAGLRLAGDLTEAVLAGGGLIASILFVRFLLRPAVHRRVVTQSSAQYAEARGGTRQAPMGA